MKATLFTILSLFIFAGLYAQQTDKLNDALLLEYYQNQRFAEAAQYLKTTYAEPVTDLKALASLAYTFQMAGKLSDAESYYLRILATDSTNIPVLFNLGNINIRRGNNIKALNYYKSILSRDSTNFKVYKQLATLSQNTGDFGSCIYYLQKANTINPTEADVAFDLATFYIGLKQIAQADKVISTALEADSADMQLLQGKAKIVYQLNKYPETIELCKKLRETGDVSYNVISMLAISYYNTKKYNECIETFSALDATHTQSEASWYYVAVSYKALGNQTKAIACLQESIKQAISANVDTYYSEMADSFDKSGRLKSAVNAYKKALQFDQKPMTYYALASLYDDKLKDRTTALKYYKLYLQANPTEKQKSYTEFVKDRVTRLAR
ncbi:hypothetical protein GCM10023149_01210 [Mucilaginibacter gynuensis]|uniref:Tetratricopeptide repeat protein n=1 Tax=Mucilaginibacter gynuensis TaxID=1302236 RepID=A0ABP8FNJ5_9SPHI